VHVFQIEEKLTLNTWDDIARRPCYLSPIDPQPNRFIRVIAVYSFKDHSAHCGVSNCNQPHHQGFMVSTSNDKETNLCEACGQRFFKVSFKDQEKALQNLDRIREQKIRLNTVLEQSEEIKARINELKRTTHGANWLYRSLSNFRKNYPKELLAALTELASSKNDNAILSTFDDNAIEQFCKEQVKQLQGLDIFTTDIKETLIRKVLTPLIQLEDRAKNQEPDSIRSLVSFCRWADSLEDQFVDAEHLVEEGRAFFKTENLERLKSIPLPEKSAHLTKSLRWDYDNAMSKRK